MKNNQPMHHDCATNVPPINIYNNTMHTFQKQGGLLLVIFILLAMQNQKSPSCTLCMKKSTNVPWQCHDCTSRQHPQQHHTHLLKVRWIVVANLYFTSSTESKKPQLIWYGGKNQPMHEDCIMIAPPINVHNNTMHTFWKQGWLLGTNNHGNAITASANNHKWKFKSANNCKCKWLQLQMTTSANNCKCKCKWPWVETQTAVSANANNCKCKCKWLQVPMQMTASANKNHCKCKWWWVQTNTGTTKRLQQQSKHKDSETVVNFYSEPIKPQLHI